jgi:glycosyltransferase involved in cell wall biosynthesis
MYSEGNLAMKKVLIIAYYFPPLGWSGVQRTLKFVKYLRKFGWEPVVVTVGETKFSILDETLVNEIPKGVQVIKIDDVKFKHVTDNAKQILKSYTECISNTILDSDLKQKYEEAIEQKISELRDLLLIPDGNAIWANNVIKSINIKIDLKDINVIYTTSAPYSSHLIGQHIKEKYNIPWVADFRDEWINNADYIIDEETLDFEIQKYMENTVVEKCDKIITTTPYASQNFVDRYNLNDKKVYTITNGYDEEDFYKIKENKKNNKFTIIHNGSCYLNRSPQTFFKAVRNLIERVS